MKHIFALASLLAVCASHAQVTWHSGALPLRDPIVWELINAGFISAPTTSYWNKAVTILPNGQHVIDTTMTSQNVGYVQIGSKSEEGSYDYLWYGQTPGYGVNTGTYVSLELTTPVEPGSVVHRISYVDNPNCLAYPEEGDEAGLEVGRLYSEMRVDARVVEN